MARVVKVEEVPDEISDIRVVRESFWYTDANGESKLLRQGATVRVGHPLIDQFEQHFYPFNHVDVDL